MNMEASSNIQLIVQSMWRLDLLEGYQIFIARNVRINQQTNLLRKIT